MDGGSKDETVEYLKGLDVSYDLIWKSEKDNGQTDAINKAIQTATGDIIGWLNSDDEYVHGILPQVLHIFETHPEIDFVHGDVFIIDENSNNIGTSKGKPVNGPEDILLDNPIKQPGLFFRRTAFEKLGILNVSLNYVMDREFWLRALNAGMKFHYIDKPLAKFRLITGTKTFESNEDFRLEWIEIMKERAEEMGLSDAKLSEAVNVNLGSYYFQKAQKHVGSPFKFCKNMYAAYKYSPILRKNSGFYKIAALGIIGIRRDRYTKYK